MTNLSSTQFSSPVHTMLEEVKKELQSIFKNRLKDIILFGSFARGNYTDESDIDLLTVLDEIKDKNLDKKKYLPFLADLSLKYDRVFSVVLFSKEEFQNKKIPLLMNVKKEGIHL